MVQDELVGIVSGQAFELDALRPESFGQERAGQRDIPARRAPADTTLIDEKALVDSLDLPLRDWRGSGGWYPAVLSQVGQQLPASRGVTEPSSLRLQCLQELLDSPLVESVDRQSAVIQPAAQIRHEPELLSTGVRIESLRRRSGSEAINVVGKRPDAQPLLAFRGGEEDLHGHGSHQSAVDGAGSRQNGYSARGITPGASCCIRCRRGSTGSAIRRPSWQTSPTNGGLLRPETALRHAHQ